MYAIDVVHKIITDNRLEKCTFYLISHKTSKNWRQVNDSYEKKVANLTDGLVFDKYNLFQIVGSKLVNMDINGLIKYGSPEKPLISLSSLFTYNDIKMHIPIMNLHLDEDNNGLQSILKPIECITSEKYWILKTDRYFHIYINNIIGYDRWFDWNLKFLMSSCLVSPRYIAQSLKRGYNLLRLNATSQIKIKIPEVIYTNG